MKAKIVADPVEYNKIVTEYTPIKKEIDREIEQWIKKYEKHPFREAGQLIRERKVPINKIHKMITLINTDVPLPKEETKEDYLKPFQNPNLLGMIKSQFDEDHLEDDNLKMTAFLVASSRLLKNPKKRMSMALTGESSVGKDNIMKTILKHMPDDYLFLTGATQPAVEDSAMFVKILALSEMNLFKEGGANKNMLEVVKQRTEGGTSSLKKDVATGFRTTKHEKTEQGTTFYGTTDAERNDETETRFIYGHVSANESKVKKVNKDTLDKHADMDKLIQQKEIEDSWIKKGLINLVEKYGDCLILIPYSHVLNEKIKGKDIIDHTNPRSMRDLKRLLALTSAMTFIFAEQRKIKEYEGVKFLISEPEDLLNTIKYSQEFFNQTYTGMDERLNDFLKIIDSSFEDWVARDHIQRLLKKSLNTIKSWTETLKSKGLIEWSNGKDLNFRLNTTMYSGNKIYLKRCQKGVKVPLIRCQYLELKQLLQKLKLIPFTQKTYQNKGVNLVEKEQTSTKKDKIDTLSLTPLEDFTPKKVDPHLHIKIKSKVKDEKA